METYELSKVFGVSRSIPLTYVERKNVDDNFRNNLVRDKHIVIYGRSKQGKTCLHKNCLKAGDYIVVQCRSTMTLHGFYETILKEAGAKIDVLEKKTTSGTSKLGVEFAVSGQVPLLAKGELKGKLEDKETKQTEIEKKHIEIDPTDPNDIIRTLEAMNFNKFIMLEDFHYLDKKVQSQIAIDLKAFHEKSSVCCFIIVGVWLEPTRMLLYNGDLAGRLIPIDADIWTDGELTKVINKGEKFLNINFSDKVKETILALSQSNVGILQETCWRLCSNHNLWQTQKTNYHIDNEKEVDKIVREIVNEQAGRYQNLLLYIAAHNKESDKDQLVKWVTFSVVTSSPKELISGLPFKTIADRIREYHPRKSALKDVEILNAISVLPEIQSQNNIQPLVLDYDFNSNILHVVDSGFMLFVEAIPDKELLKLIDIEDVVLPGHSDKRHVS